jgi:hypothetical protein
MAEYKYNVGDIGSDQKGSGARANGGKTEFHLVPLNLLEGTAQVFMYGREKYAEWNWAKGMAWTIPYDCAQRHLSAWFFEREEADKESGLHHIDHAICNLLMLRHYLSYYPEGDDRPVMFGKEDVYAE